MTKAEINDINRLAEDYALACVDLRRAEQRKEQSQRTLDSYLRSLTDTKNPSENTK